MIAPNQSAAANRHPAGQSDGADNLLAIVAADRALPAAVAELGRCGERYSFFMSKLYSLLLGLVLILAGCAAPSSDVARSSTSTIRKGRDFDTSKVKDIQKGKTTSQEIVQWFGQPSAKKIISTNQIGWLYAWRQSTITVNRTAKTAKGKETGYRKRLELLITDEVVSNYTFDEGPFEADGSRDTK